MIFYFLRSRFLKQKDSKNKHLFGFTIVELLVTIVIISILATITIISYRGISQKAAEAAVISDLDTVSKKMKLSVIENSGYPTDVSKLTDCPTPATGNICVKLSPNNSFGTYYINNSVNPQTFCLTIKSTNITKSVNNDGAPVDGSCPPANLKVTGTTTNTVSLSWDSVVGAVNYTVQRSSTSDFASHVDATIAAGTTVYTSTGLVSGTYYYRVNVIDANSTSAWSSFVSAQLQTVLTYASPGAFSFIVPAGVTSLKLETWGAQGGDGMSDSGNGCSSTTFYGGKGGYSVGTLTVTPATTVYINVGGLNGGGTNGFGGKGGKGGGASDVRYGGNSLANRVIVAGGGGGGTGSIAVFTTDVDYYCSISSNGGVGGGTNGGNDLASDSTTHSAGGTQSTGYGLGVGGPAVNSYSSAGGGAGYYGGFGSTNYGYGGGGGSGYIGGVTSGATYAGNTLFPAPVSGNETGQSGNGYIKITY